MKTIANLLDADYKKRGLHLYPGSLNIELESEWSMPGKTSG
jgi:hypothetical protein